MTQSDGVVSRWLVTGINDIASKGKQIDIQDQLQLLPDAARFPQSPTWCHSQANKPLTFAVIASPFLSPKQEAADHHPPEKGRQKKWKKRCIQKKRSLTAVPRSIWSARWVGLRTYRMNVTRQLTNIRLDCLTDWSRQTKHMEQGRTKSTKQKINNFQVSFPLWAVKSNPHYEIVYVGAKVMSVTSLFSY